MSKISDAIQGLEAILATLYPNHKELTNPYKVEQCNEKDLVLGYGLKIGRGENTERFSSCKKSENRDIIIVLTRRFIGLDFDIDKKRDVELALIDDQDLLKNYFEQNTSVVFSTTTANFKWVGDDGIEHVFGNKESFIKIETTLQTEVFEKL